MYMYSLHTMYVCVQMVAKGKDCSDLFPAVVKNVVSKNSEVRVHACTLTQHRLVSLTVTSLSLSLSLSLFLLPSLPPLHAFPSLSIVSVCALSVVIYSHCVSVNIRVTMVEPGDNLI